MLPFPEESLVMVPVPSSNFQYAARPVSTVLLVLMVKVSVVEALLPPPAALMVSGNVPVGTVPVLGRVKVVEQVTVQVVVEKVAVTLLGMPDTEKDTLWAEPEVSVAVIVALPDCPGLMETADGEAAIEKANVGPELIAAAVVKV